MSKDNSLLEEVSVDELDSLEDSDFEGFDDFNSIDDIEGDLDRQEVDALDEDDLSKLSDKELDELLGEVESDDDIISESFEGQEDEEDNDIEVLRDKEDEGIESTKYESIGADHDGTILNKDALLAEDYDVVDKDADFISDTGEIVVMDNCDNGDNFVLKYIDIKNIAIVKRIRKNNTNVEDLVQSIKSTGLLEPLVVAPTATDGFYVLLAGFRRIMACARAGKRMIPCIVNTKVNIPEIPVLEALYNHSKRYTIREIVDYIDYLEKQKGIMSASMIEYLLQLNSGDYTKLKDILNDNDEDIVDKLFNGIYTIDAAFKKLEQRRKKESAEEKENKKAAKVYDDTEESGADKIAGSGEESNDAALTDEEIASLAISVDDLSNVDDISLDEMVEESKNMEGFEPHRQDPNDRERIDPAIRKAVMSRDNNTCQCCLRGGPDYVDILDLHHIVEVYLGGVDSVENSITLCLNCHKQVHSFAFNQLHIPKSKTDEELAIEIDAFISKIELKNKEEGKGELTEKEKDEIRQQRMAIYKEEQSKYKRIVKLGNVIRKGLQKKQIKLEQAKKEHPIDKIGRQKPGHKNTIA